MYSVDIMNPDSPAMKHARVFDTHLLSLDLAPSGEALALADAQCTLHLWGAPSKIQFNEYKAREAIKVFHSELRSQFWNWKGHWERTIKYVVKGIPPVPELPEIGVTQIR